MSFIFLLLLALFASFFSLHASPIPPPRGYYLNCGSPEEITAGGKHWTGDDSFINSGNVSKLEKPDINPVLSYLRYFPDKSASKCCYEIPVAKRSKYLIRTTYYYGGFDGGREPPVFDQIVGGTKWSVVNTSENYRKGLSSYYEIVVMALGKTMSVCLARNENTVGDPFISALELQFLEKSMYGSIDFRQYALGTIARHSFGQDSQIMSYPDDPFNRNWESFIDKNPAVQSVSNVTSSTFWNLPPEMAFRRALTTSRGKDLVVHWPETALPSSHYYIALYFQDNRTPSPFSWRVFDVKINGGIFYSSLNVSTAGVMVYGTDWPLSGQIQVTMIPSKDSTVGPVINAGEILQFVPLSGRTHTRDVIAMESIARSLRIQPSDWRGDPCFPRENSWTGIRCSEGKTARIVSLNLTDFRVSGVLSESIANLTAISSIWLAGNNLFGRIPDLSSLKQLKSLHLENNKLSGAIPATLGNLEKLQELFLQNNNLYSGLPESLKMRTGINIQALHQNQIN